MDDLDEATAKFRYSNFLSNVTLSWIVGLLCLSVPYNVCWGLGNGNFGYDILNTIYFAALGVFLVRMPLDLENISDSKIKSNRIIGYLNIVFYVVILMLLTGLAYFNFSIKLYLLALCLTVTFHWFVWAVSIAKSWSFSKELFFRKALKSSWVFNSMFWCILLIVLLYCDLYALLSIDSDNSIELIGSLLNRVATQFVCVLGLLFVFNTIMNLTPYYFRVVVCQLFSLLPFLVILDFLLKQYWNQSLLTIINLLTSSGSIDLEKEIAASGINLSLMQLSVIIIITALLALLFYWILNWVSRLVNFRITNKFIFTTSLICWIFVIAESGLSHFYKRTEQWQRHYKLYGSQIGIFAPPAGFEKMDISFRDLSTDSNKDDLLGSLEDSPEFRKPDIYVFMIESWRSDSITPEVAPFLSKFKKEECQDLGRTYAGSNCTPLSWFSMFHSKLAIHWSDSLKKANESNKYGGAYPMRVLKKLGYEIQVRAVCDLRYRNLGSLNFGNDHSLVDHLTHYTETNNGPVHISEREKLVMGHQREHLDSNPESPQFHFTALDSPHYNYYWPSDFDQLHADCANDIPVKLNPSKDIIGDVVRRYENAVHWVDYAIEEFVDFLKFKGTYDNSVIIITGDHGEEFQEEGSWFHCSSLNRFQTEVPIIIKWPEWIKDPPSHTNVSHYDIMPSVLNLIGLESKFYDKLAGQSVLQYGDSPREVVLSTVHRGESGIGFCLVGNKSKVKFSFPGPWSTDAPDQLVVSEYSDILDRPVDFRQEIGDMTHADYIRKKFPQSSGRFFERFEKH
ncbi:MAG: hypothetical protein CMO46_09440 [Verrucomicrobiales bacterium]|nr:hypothetical protein [Verrucomicrobiales bacterium]